MRQRPEQPGGEPGQAQGAHGDHGGLAPDGGEGAGVLVAERRRIRATGDPGGDDLGHVGAFLLGGGRDARNQRAVGVLQTGGVADDEHLGQAGQRQVGLNQRPSGPVFGRVQPLRCR